MLIATPRVREVVETLLAASSGVVRVGWMLQT